MLTMSRSLAPIHKALKPGPQWPTRPWSSCHGARKRHAVHFHGHHAYHQHHPTKEYHVASCEGTPRRLSLDRPASPSPPPPPPHLLSTAAAHLATVPETQPCTAAVPISPSTSAGNIENEDTQVVTLTATASNNSSDNSGVTSTSAQEVNISPVAVPNVAPGSDTQQRSVEKPVDAGLRSGNADAEAGQVPVLSVANDDAAVACNITGHAPWSDLDSNMLSMVALMLPREASTQMGLMQVCTLWRQTLMTDCQIWSHAWFKLNPTKPLKTSTNNSSTKASSSADAQTKPVTFNRIMLPPRSEDKEGADNHSGADSDDQSMACNSGRLYTCANLHTHPAASRFQRMQPRAPDDEDDDDFGRMALPQPRRAGGFGAKKQLLGPALLRAVPKFLQHAARAGNASAMACMAQLHEVHGKEDDAVRWWKKCAKLGDAEAALRLGMAYYQGTPECPVDSEAAQLWLAKGLKWTLGVASLSNISVDLAAETVTVPLNSGNAMWDASADGSDGSGNATPGVANPMAGLTAVQREILRRQRREQRAQELAATTPSPVQQMVTLTLPELWSWRSGAAVPAPVQRAMDAAGNTTTRTHQSTAPAAPVSAGNLTSLSATTGNSTPRHGVVATIDYSCSQLLPMIGAAAVMLAFLYFDGEGGLKTDKAQACVLFKLSALCGSTEAAQVLGWIFSTGQYGQ